jgi:putative membrane protein
MLNLGETDMPLLERASSARRIGPWSLVGLVLVPIVVAASFLWATWDSPTRLDQVQAAVVNLDEPVKLDGKTVPLGRQLAGELVSGKHDVIDGHNLHWVITDAKDAAAGLESGSYTAVVTIPKDFSQRASSFSKTKADDIEAATIAVRTSDASGVADPLVGQALSNAATSALNTSLTEGYLKGIYVGFNDISKSFDTVAKAADKLGDGSGKISDGLDKTADGSLQLADGLGKLHTGATQLATGVKTLDSGTGKLADGLDQLADGAEQLPPGARKLADGTAKSADGAHQLADGADQFATGVGSLRNGTKAQPGGTKAFAAGLQQYADGVKAYESTFAGMAKLSDADLRAQFPDLCPKTATDDECQPALAGFRTVVGGLSPAAQQFATGAAGIDTGVGKLATGASGIADGTSALAKGLDQLADGSDTFADGVKPLVKGIRTSADGAGKLADGVNQLSTGATALATGAGQSASGARDLSTGVRKLADGSAKVTDGTHKLADGLAKGADNIPTYNEETRQKLSSVVAAPVQVPAPTSAFSNVTTTSLLMVLALWAGALAAFIVLRPVTARVLGSMKPSWRLALEGLLPAAVVGVVQAIALTVIVAVLLDLSFGATMRVGGLSLLLAVTFAAVNQALVVWLGGVGRFVSLVVLVLTAAGALTSAIPDAFHALQPFLPLTPALDGLRAVLGDAGGAGSSVFLLAAWLLVGIVAAVLAVARRRVVAPLVSPVPAL